MRLFLLLLILFAGAAGAAWLGSLYQGMEARFAISLVFFSLTTLAYRWLYTARDKRK